MTRRTCDALGNISPLTTTASAPTDTSGGGFFLHDFRANREMVTVSTFCLWHQGVIAKHATSPERGTFQMDLIHDEAKLTIDKVTKQQERIAYSHGLGCGVGAVAITTAYIGRLIEAVPRAIARIQGAKYNYQKGLAPILRMIPPEKLALVALQGTLHSIGLHDRWGRTLRLLGRTLENEAFAAGLTKHDKRLSLIVEQRAKASYSTVNRRVKASRAQAEIAGFRVAEWKPAQRTIAGGWLLGLLLEALPDVFMIDGLGEYKCVTLQPEAYGIAARAVDELIDRNYVLLPLTVPPVPWTAVKDGGAPHRTDTVIRTHFAEVRAATAAAIRGGAMQPALDGLNFLQGTAWTLNTHMADIVEACADAKLRIKGMPQQQQPVPRTKTAWDSMSKEAQQLYMQTKAEIKKHNQRCLGDEIMLQFDLSTARLLKGKERFWTPMNLDFRGRAYGLTMFHFGRDDRVRSMFLFADGEPLGEDGLRWLKIHTANTGAFEKVDKQPLHARVAWVDANLSRLRSITASPMTETWWQQADKPFLFLAACFELLAAMDAGPSYVCRLPVSFDGSCSGLQHLACMTRAPEGNLVNLAPVGVPQDVYAQVASRVAARLVADAAKAWPEEDAHKGEIARMALAYGVDRKMVKRNVMTFCYGSKPHGMASQQQEDLMNRLAAAKVAGEIAAHPFGAYARGSVPRPGKAARYLARHTYDAISETLNLPAQAMDVLRQIAKVLAHERKSARWTTPVGLPWTNRYHEPIIETVELWMHDKGVRVRTRTAVVVGDTVEVNKEKSANAIAPNFVHGCDAAHLLLVARAAAAEGMGPMATVHDSFGCLPSKAKRFNEIIREQLVTMYEKHDVLAEILEQAKRDLTLANHHRLPTVPEYGTLDLKGILDAQFAFS